MSKTGILFDLDGTLLNTNGLVLESLQYTIRKHLGIEADPGDLYKYFGRPLVTIMADISPEHAEEMVMTYREYSAVRHDDLVTAFPQVTETIKHLKSTGIFTAVVTSKLRSLALRGLKLVGLEELFDTYVAFEDTQKHKPEPEPALKALEAMGIGEFQKDGVIMVGDSPYDILCARNAGIRSAVVEWSLHPHHVLASSKPDLWLKQFPDILNYIS